MRILFYLLMCFTALTASGQISDSEILEEVIEHLEYYEENQYDRMVDYSIKSSSETVTSAFGDFSSIYSRAAMLEYRTYDGKRAIYKGIVGVAKDTRPGSDGRYFVLFGDEHIYKFGTWLIKDDYGDLYEKRVYNDRGLLTELYSYYEGELFTIEKFKGIALKEEPFETYYYEDGVLDYKEMEDADYGLNSDGSVNWKINKVNGQRHGDFEQYYTDTKQIQFKGTYVNGEREGKYESYFESGQLRELTYYKNGKRNGSYVSYLEDGTLEEEGNYSDGEKDGTWKFIFSTSSDFEYPYFTDEDFDLEKELDLEDYFYKTGKFRNGEEKEGEVQLYYLNGAPLVEYTSSRLKYLYRNGEVCLEGKISRYGEPKGTWSFYDESGDLVKKLEVDDY